MREGEPEFSGKMVILGMMALAVVATGYAWWHQQSQGRAALEFWGQDAAYLIRHAREIELVTVGSNGEERTRGLTKARGLIHARQALIVDASYDWDAELTGLTPKWHYGMRFHGDEQRDTCTLWFDLDQQLAGIDSDDRIAKIRIADGLRKFLDETVEIAKKSGLEDGPP